MPGMRHMGLRVHDLARSRQFYEEGLQLSFLGYRPSGDAIDLTDGAINLTLLPYDGPQRAPFEEGTEFIHVGFLVENVAATYRRLQGLGVTIVRDDVKERRPHDGAAPPVRSFKALDPDGNVIDISDQPDEWRTEA